MVILAMEIEHMDTFSLACLMARTGHYKSWYQIELHLRFAGLDGAHKELGGFYARRFLNRLCHQARTAHDSEGSGSQPQRRKDLAV